MFRQIKEILSEYEINPITELNYKQVIEIYDTNQDFFTLTEGKTAKPEDILNSIDLIPPNFEINNKLFISIRESGRVIGVLDFLLGYPVQASVWIGLLLIHGDLHGNKIGSRIAGAVLKAAKNTGYKSVQLGVIENNSKGIDFWLKQGFAKINESKIKRDNGTDLNIIVMENCIVSA